MCAIIAAVAYIAVEATLGPVSRLSHWAWDSGLRPFADLLSMAMLAVAATLCFASVVGFALGFWCHRSLALRRNRSSPLDEQSGDTAP